MADSLSVKKLNSDNYAMRKFKLQMLLMKDDLWTVIVGTKPTDVTKHEQWNRKDDKTRALIGLTVEDSQVNLMKSATTAKQVWEELQQYYEKATLTNEVMLLKQLCLMRYEDDQNMEEHLVQMDNLVDKVTALGLEIPKRLRIVLMLCSLPDSYSSLVTALEVRPSQDLTFNLVKNAIIAEYKRREGQLRMNDNSEIAMRVNSNRKEVICYFCHRKGYLKQNCRRYLEWKRKVENLRAHAVKSDNDDSDSNNESSFLDFAFVAYNNKQKDKWFFDSGATKHMTNEINFFTALNTNYKSTVRVANKGTSQVYGIGSGKLQCVNSKGEESCLELIDVLYVPDFNSNLISMSMLDKKDYSATIQHGLMKIFKNSREVAVGDANNGMYELRLPQKALVAGGSHNDNCIHQWHKRLAHRDPEAIKRLETEELATGIHIQNCNISSRCESCIKGKMPRTSFPKHSIHLTTAPRQLVHTNLCGPISTKTAGGKRYIITLIDDFSRHCQLFLLSKKSQASSIIKNYVPQCKTQFNEIPRAFRSDRGGEYLSNELKNYFNSQGIKQQLTAPYSPQQNGVAERKNRYLLEATRTMMIQANLDEKYSGETVMIAGYLQNRLPTKATGKTPHELWYGTKPNLSHIKVFGCKAFVHVPKEKRKKLDKKATAYTFVGYSQESKAYRILDQDSGKVVISRDVFIEDEQVETGMLKESSPCEEVTYLDNYTQDEQVKEQPGTLVHDKPENKLLDTSSTSRGNNSSIFSLDDVPLATRLESLLDYRLPDFDENIEPKNGYSNTNETLNNMEISYSTEESNAADPKNPEEAFSGPNAAQWKKTMTEEIQSLEDNNTWTLVQLPPGKIPIGCRWVFKLKKDSEGKPTKFKARLVAQGFTQKFGQDYDETFAPVVKNTTLRALLSIAGNRNYFIKHYDGKIAFLNGQLKEDIYMRQPSTHITKGQEQLVYKLKRSI